MAKIRKGRLAAAACVLGVVTWGVLTQSAGDPSREVSDRSTESPAEPAQTAKGPVRSQAGVAATQWAERTAQLGSLLEGFPSISVHCLRSYANGTLRLECSAPGRSLSDVARFRAALKSHSLCSGSTLTGKQVQIRQHHTCESHGHISEVMVFSFDLTPDAGSASSAEPGVLNLVARCSTN